MVLPKQRKCCVPYCSFEGIHQFPSNFERRNAWIDALSTDNWSPVASVSKVCTQHFTPDDYVIPKNGSLGKAARVLKPNAVPTQNIWSKQASSVAAAREMAKKRKMSSNSVSAKRPRPSGSGLNNFGAVMRQEENASVLPSNLSVVSQHTNPQRVQNTNVERGWMMEILPDDEPDYPEIKEEEEIKIEDDDVILAEDPLAIHPQDILLEKRKSPLSLSDATEKASQDTANKKKNAKRTPGDAIKVAEGHGKGQKPKQNNTKRTLKSPKKGSSVTARPNANKSVPELSTEEEAEKFRNQVCLPMPPLDPLVMSVVNSGKFQQEICVLLKEVTEAYHAKKAAWDAMEKYFRRLSK